MISFVTIFLIGIFGVLFFLFRHDIIYKKSDSFKIASVSTILSIFISIISLKLTDNNINILALIIGSILNFYFANELAAGKIDKKKFIKTLSALSLFFFSSIFQYIPIIIFNITEELLTSQVEILITAFSDVLTVLILIFMYYDDLKKGFISARKNFNGFFDTSFRIWSLGFIGMTVSNLLINTLAPQAVAGNENAVQSMINVSPFIMLLCAGVIAPIVEELVFRKSFQDVFKNKMVFILVSGLVFGSLHVIFAYESLIDFLYVIPYTSLGIAFSYMVYKTDNILSSIMMHFIHNTAIICFSILVGMIVL